MNPFVLDASVALSWFVDVPVHPYAAQLSDRLAQGRARGISPQLFPLEFGNGILVAERKKLLPQTEAGECIDKLNLLLNSSVELDAMRPPVGELLQLARRCQLTVYDATYLELAVRHNVPIATLDKSLQAAAKLVGVKFA